MKQDSAKPAGGFRHNPGSLNIDAHGKLRFVLSAVHCRICRGIDHDLRLDRAHDPFQRLEI